MARRSVQITLIPVPTWDLLWSQWFREHLYRSDGKYHDLQTFIRGEWESGFLDWDANDLLTLMHTWSSGDISKINHNGDFASAMRSISPRGLTMPCKTDLYFPVSVRSNSLRSNGNDCLSIAGRQWGWSLVLAKPEICPHRFCMGARSWWRGRSGRLGIHRERNYQVFWGLEG